MKKIKRIRFLAMLLCVVMTLNAVPLTANAVKATDEDLLSPAQQESTSAIEESRDFSSLSLTEDVTLRDRFTKHYIDPNGERYMVIFPEQVHYEENGQWVEVDNSLTLDGLTKQYVSQNEQFKTRFAQSTNHEQLVTIEDGDYSLSWSVVFASPNKGNATMEMSASNEQMAAAQLRIEAASARVAEVDNLALQTVKDQDSMTRIGKAASAITYEKVHNNTVDLRYSILHGRVEEDVILYSPENFTSYTMMVDTNGLTAVKCADNSVEFIDENGEAIFRIGAPWMKDSDIAVSDAIAVSIVQKGDYALINYTPSAEWLNDPSRVYPVLIDPSVTTRNYTNNYQDTYVYEGDTASATRASETTMKVGNINGAKHCAYLKILNVPELVGFGYIEEAYLTFYADTTAAPALNIYEVTGAWDPATITYATQPSADLLKGNLLGEVKYPDEDDYSTYTVDLTNWAEWIDEEHHWPSYFSSSLWNGFRLEYATNLTNNYTQIYSSEFFHIFFRPTMTIKYTYNPNGASEDGAVYSFVNVASNKYLTVDGGNTANETNVYQYTKNNTRSQAFRLDYNETNDGYTIRSMCSEDGYGSLLTTKSFSEVSNSTTGETDNNVRLHSTNIFYKDREWLIEVYDYEEGLFRIVLSADPDLALTAYGAGNGTATGTSTTSEGNVFVSTFTGASNQLWKLESGGVQVIPGVNIKDAIVAGSSYTISQNASWLTFNCPVTAFGDTVVWSSFDTYSATVEQTGHVHTHGVGSTSIRAKVTHADGTSHTYSRWLYVTISDGVYYFNDKLNENRLEYEEPDSYDENTVLESYLGDLSEPTQRYRLFKVKHVGYGNYVIRSMLDNSMGWYQLNYQKLVISTIGTSNSSYPMEAEWTLETDANGVYIYHSYEPTEDTVTAGLNSGDDITLQSYSPTNLLQHWTLTRATANYHGVTILDKTDRLAVNEQFTFTAAVYSSYTNVNGQDGITWSVTNGTGSATIDSTTGVLTGVSEGTVTVTATYSYSSYQQWTTQCLVYIIPIPEGIYFFINGIYGRHMQIDESMPISSSGASLELSYFDGGSDQKWQIEYISDGYYKIVSVASGMVATAPTSINGTLTQTIYTGSDRQLWRISFLEDEVYEISPKSNPSYHMAAGDGEDLQMKEPHWNKADEWEFHMVKDYALMFIGKSIGDPLMPPILSASEAALQGNANWTGYGYRSLYVSDILVHMSSTSFFSCITHGTRTSITAFNGQLYTSGIDSLDDTAFDNLKLVYYGACYTGNSGSSGVNLVDATYNKGADVVVGFTGLAAVEEVNIWTPLFIKHLSLGKTVKEAMDAADNEWAKDDSITVDQNTTGKNYRYIRGDTNIVVCS